MSDKSRRKLLKSIAAGSGAVIAGKSLPENWSKPVVDSVLLPVHAQTSQVPVSPLSCESTQAPFGSHTPPGPDIDVSGGSIPLPVLVTVTPPPVAPNDVILAELFENGVFITNANFTLAADGTYTVPVTSGTTIAVIELRITWQGEQCSLFWNKVNPGAPISNPVSVSVAGV